MNDNVSNDSVKVIKREIKRLEGKSKKDEVLLEYISNLKELLETKKSRESKLKNMEAKKDVDAGNGEVLVLKEGISDINNFLVYVSNRIKSKVPYIDINEDCKEKKQDEVVNQYSASLKKDIDKAKTYRQYREAILIVNRAIRQAYGLDEKHIKTLKEKSNELLGLKDVDKLIDDVKAGMRYLISGGNIEASEKQIEAAKQVEGLLKESKAIGQEFPNCNDIKGVEEELVKMDNKKFHGIMNNLDNSYQISIAVDAEVAQKSGYNIGRTVVVSSKLSKKLNTTEKKDPKGISKSKSDSDLPTKKKKNVTQKFKGIFRSKSDDALSKMNEKKYGVEKPKGVSKSKSDSDLPTKKKKNVTQKFKGLLRRRSWGELSNTKNDKTLVEKLKNRESGSTKADVPGFEETFRKKVSKTKSQKEVNKSKSKKHEDFVNKLHDKLKSI